MQACKTFIALGTGENGAGQDWYLCLARICLAGRKQLVRLARKWQRDVRNKLAIRGFRNYDFTGHAGAQISVPESVFLKTSEILSI